MKPGAGAFGASRRAQRATSVTLHASRPMLQARARSGGHDVVNAFRAIQRQPLSKIGAPSNHDLVRPTRIFWTYCCGKARRPSRSGARVPTRGAGGPGSARHRLS